jgi:hypothetical protein
VVIGGAACLLERDYLVRRPFWLTMQLLGLYVVVFLKCFLGVFGQQVHPQHNVADLHWKPATATWYGSPDGDGSDGGCSLYVVTIVFPIL